MNITLDHIVPAPLAGTFSLHQVWNTKTVLSDPGKYLVRAHSGKGKSTLLQIVYGIRKDYDGNLLFDDENASELTPSQWSDVRNNSLSMVFQDLRLFPNLTARENIEIKSRLWPGFQFSYAENLAKEMDVFHLLDKKCGILSLGQQQRIAIIRSLCQPFRFLLMDEPFSHLDDLNTGIICRILEQECKSRSAGLIMTSLGETYPLIFDLVLNI